MADQERVRLYEASHHFDCRCSNGGCHGIGPRSINHQLIEMAKNHAPGLEQALRGTLTDANIQKGTAAAGEQCEFVVAVTAEKQPMLVISAPRTGDAPPWRLRRSAICGCIRAS
jgi:hypothetical protein